MAQVRVIKRRIKSAKNIAQITKAMEMVAASKMKKAQNLAISGKPYAQKIYEAVFDLSHRLDTKAHPFLLPNLGTPRSLVILISTNKGLCGGLNTNLFRSVNQWFLDKKTSDFVTLGKKGESFVVKSQRKLVASFGQTDSFINHIGAVIQFVIQEYLSQKYNQVNLCFNNFLTALKQEPKMIKILPLSAFGSENKINDSFAEFIVEPSADILLESLLPHYLENQLRSAILEAEASEHSARMLAMKNATDSAMDLMHELTLEFNKARQEKITYEIADMVTARMAFE